MWKIGRWSHLCANKKAPNNEVINKPNKSAQPPPRLWTLRCHVRISGIFRQPEWSVDECVYSMVIVQETRSLIYGPPSLFLSSFNARSKNRFNHTRANVSAETVNSTVLSRRILANNRWMTMIAERDRESPLRADSIRWKPFWRWERNFTAQVNTQLHHGALRAERSASTGKSHDSSFLADLRPRSGVSEPRRGSSNRVHTMFAGDSCMWTW